MCKGKFYYHRIYSCNWNLKTHFAKNNDNALYIAPRTYVWYNVYVNHINISKSIEFGRYT